MFVKMGNMTVSAFPPSDLRNLFSPGVKHTFQLDGLLAFLPKFSDVEGSREAVGRLCLLTIMITR